METRSLGGVLLAFCGLVLLIAGFRGTLGKVWQDVTGIGAATGKVDTLAPATGDQPPSPVDPNKGAITFALPAGYPGTGNILPAGVPGSAVTG